MDAGLKLVNHLYEEMQIDAEWSERSPRGFTWWAGNVAQHVWAEEPFDDLGVELVTVHAETDFLSKPTWRASDVEALGVYAGLATMSGLLEVEGGLRLAARVYVHDDTLEMWSNLLTVAALLQVTTAHFDAPRLAEMLEARPATSQHPESGPRTGWDDMLNVVRDIFQPQGVQQSFFVGDDFLTAKDYLDDGVSVFTTADEDALTAEFPFGAESALFQMETREPNPQLGNGLLMRLTLPWGEGYSGRAKLALELNRRELSDFTRTPFLGSWCPHPTLDATLAFVTFMPSATHMPGLAFTLALYSASRSRWAEEQTGGAALEEPKQKAGRRFFRRRQK